MFSKMAHLFGLLLAVSPVALAAPAASLEERQWIPPCHPVTWEEKVGDGKPRQNYKYMQLTNPKNCGSNKDCEISTSDVEGTTTSWSASVSLNSWFSGGFEVSEYSESGEVASCGGDPFDKICVWWRFAHTTYDVVQKEKACSHFDDKTGKQKGDPFVVTSPNKAQVGSGYVCAKNDKCKSKGHYFWADHKDVKGAAQQYPFTTEEEIKMLVPGDKSEDFPKPTS